REEGLAGAPVLKGLFGFGSKSHLNSGKHLRLEENPPIVIEIVDSGEKVGLFLKRLDEFVREGFVTLDDVQMISYRTQ
ncbi:MAG: DUF190 domain-containing protein, partial [candidate division NC10 bacterium]